MEKLLQQIISHFAIALMLFIFPLNVVIGNNNQGSRDEILQKKIDNWTNHSYKTIHQKIYENK